MPNNGLPRLCAQIVAAHVGHHIIQASELPGFIRTVYKALLQAGTPAPETGPFTPAVPIKRSVFPDYLVCLEDGRKLKVLKRHLRSAYGMTPDDYRAKWGLPDSYPMTAPDYAARRATLAKKFGLGRLSKNSPAEVPVQKIAAGVRGRKPGRKNSTPAESQNTSGISE